jgi:hypothetical protein
MLILQSTRCSTKFIDKWFCFDIIYNFYFSINHILRTTRNARIPPVQSTVPVPLRPSAGTVLIQYGQYPSNARTIYGRTVYGYGAQSYQVVPGGVEFLKQTVGLRRTDAVPFLAVGIIGPRFIVSL